MASRAAIRCSLKHQGKNSHIFIIPMNTFIQPAAVYILMGKPKKIKPLCPKGVTKACKPGPTMNPSTCDKEVNIMILVRKLSVKKLQQQKNENISLLT